MNVASRMEKENVVNRMKMLVIANSICLELIVWSAIDENGTSGTDYAKHEQEMECLHTHYSLDGDMVCTTISEKMWQPHKHVLAQMPVNVAALEALGGMAEKFPSLANTFVIRLLCKFLLDPCPVLAKLASEAVS